MGYLKFISGKYQGGEFPLEMDSEIVIGRSSELDMVLVEDMVSRRHARITTFDGEVMIEDLGSVNGTFINGERVAEARLEAGDRILVGTNIIKYCESSDREQTSLPFTSQRGYSMGVVQPLRASGQRVHSTDVPLVDLIQLFSTSRRTTLIQYEPHPSVNIYLRYGLLHWVTFQDEPDPFIAFARILQLDDAFWLMSAPWDGTPVVPEPLDIEFAPFLLEVEKRLQTCLPGTKEL